MSDEPRLMDHAAVDQLAGAYALGAVDANEGRAVADHLAACDEPHAELRDLVGADQVLAMSLEPVEPSPALRGRLLATVGRTPQDHAVAAAQPMRPSAAQPSLTEAGPRRGWLGWLSPAVVRPLAVVVVVALLAVGGWNISLLSELEQRDRVLRAVAEAIADGEVAFRVEGSAGRGYVVDTPGSGAALVVADLASLPADRLYELWLLDATGTPVPVGTFTPSASAVAVVPVERDLAGYVTFAVTVEASRVDAPTGDIVMLGGLEG